MVAIDTLFIDGVRNISAQQIALSAGLNFFEGRNGAGKTSVLEAAFMLSRGRSFRSFGARACLQRGRDSAIVRAHRGAEVLGLERRIGTWSARADGVELSSLADVSRLLPAMLFHPETHGDFFGEADQRRRTLDWAVFHVEPGFAAVWRAHQRAVRQRNAALVSNEPFQAPMWNPAMSREGAELNALREGVFARVAAEFTAIHRELGHDSRTVSLAFRRGWADGSTLESAIDTAWERDLAAGYSTVGAHRADLSMTALELRAASTLSRGEGKLAVLSLILAIGAVVQPALDRPMLLLLDDLPAELDSTRLTRLLGLLGRSGYQILASGVACPDLSEWPREHALFHVEQGKIDRVL